MPQAGLAPTVRAWEWQLAAACRDHGEEDFFAPAGPVESNEARLARQARAKAVCVQCPVRVHCLDQALASGEAYGIWGGLTPGERSRLPLRTPWTAAGTGPAAARGQYGDG